VKGASCGVSRGRYGGESLWLGFSAAISKVNSRCSVTLSRLLGELMSDRTLAFSKSDNNVSEFLLLFLFIFLFILLSRVPDEPGDDAFLYPRFHKQGMF
jgi:hypothetical protein